MSRSIAVDVPEDVQKYTPHLQSFVAGMVQKLHRNAHKNTPNVTQIGDIVSLLKLEVAELEEQLNEEKFNSNSMFELYDVANFAFLTYLALRLDGVSAPGQSDLFNDVGHRRALLPEYVVRYEPADRKDEHFGLYMYIRDQGTFQMCYFADPYDAKVTGDTAWRRCMGKVA